MIYEGIVKVHNKSLFSFSAEGQAIQQMEALKEDLPDVVNDFQTLKTEKENGEYITKFLVSYKGQDRDELTRRAEEVGTTSIMKFEMEYETF